MRRRDVRGMTNAPGSKQCTFTSFSLPFSLCLTEVMVNSRPKYETDSRWPWDPPSGEKSPSMDRALLALILLKSWSLCEFRIKLYLYFKKNSEKHNWRIHKEETDTVVSCPALIQMKSVVQYPARLQNVARIWKNGQNGRHGAGRPFLPFRAILWSRAGYSLNCAHKTEIARD